ncbi:aspartyl/asparaginyl beta-hydroxylase domain-containing protein [Solimonas soli]|uniref:aspartyl/asparaginyl beta-hydroxylase domain-containing protein n=1 Tax=Solimonas soli TaxID=413479 RepID=UPI0004B7A46F|nr:aspartyl/asparaginyl beta-hydroxylase domain-containing protein [Solimonas soli]
MSIAAMAAPSWLAPVLQLRWFIAAAWMAAIVYVHRRGVVRHRFRRQLLDHSSLTAPINVVLYASSAVPAQPLLDLQDFPELKILRDHWREIRDEAARLYGIGGIGRSDGLNDLGFNSFFKKGWGRFYFHWYGRFLPSALRECPRTCELLRQVPGVKAAMFTLLAPGSRLPLHRDPFAGSLRYHLGLITPNSDACRLIVDGRTYAWRDGEDVLFDETYIHTAENKTDQTRIILFCDVERPLNNPLARVFNRFIGRTLAAASASRNEAGEPLGALNHLFRYLYSIRIVGKKLKAWNQPVYYLIKYALFASILGALLWRRH